MLTKREELAAAILPGLVPAESGPSFILRTDKKRHEVARAAFKLADAMLEVSVLPIEELYGA